MANCFLIQPEGFVGKAVPDFGEEPADRVAASFKTACEGHGVSEPRRIPENQFAPVRASCKDVVGRGFRHVRPVCHFANVAHQQRASERCLADVGMAHQAQMNAQRIRRKRHVVSKEGTLFSIFHYPAALRRRGEPGNAKRHPHFGRKVLPERPAGLQSFGSIRKACGELREVEAELHIGRSERERLD